MPFHCWTSPPFICIFCMIVNRQIFVVGVLLLLRKDDYNWRIDNPFVGSSKMTFYPTHVGNLREFITHNVIWAKENWWKGKPPGSIACTRKQQPQFYWSRSSLVMNDAIPLTPPSAWAELYFQMLTTYMYNPWSLRTRKI